MDLFEAKSQKASSASEPLASRLRPASFADFAGQGHIVGEGTLLRRLIESDRLTSLIFYGPPGTGKTTLAGIISRETKAHFESVNAVTANVADLRKVLEKAESTARLNGKKSVLFIDELHRFSKSQQDVLMPYVEKGNPILIGATTHNPYFYIVPPLLSRSVVFELKPLTKEDVAKLLERALADKEKGLGKIAVEADPKALAFLAEVSDGDARRALNALEIGVLSTKPDAKGKVRFTLEAAQESIQKKAVLYDRDEDAHYDTISAFIKSMRGSDPDAALYYLAKMLYAGEDPRFIARRIVICAAEDVGNADPQALVVATAAMHAAEFVGLPESRIPLAQAAVYVACAPKSNAAYLGIEKAMKDVEQGRTLDVPKHLQDASYSGAKTLGRGTGYKYAHDGPKHHVKQDYLPEARVYYEPTDLGFEKTIKEWLKRLAQSEH